jgi:hypothetical protein
VFEIDGVGARRSNDDKHEDEPEELTVKDLAGTFAFRAHGFVGFGSTYLFCHYIPFV